MSKQPLLQPEGTSRVLSAINQDNTVYWSSVKIAHCLSINPAAIHRDISTLNDYFVAPTISAMLLVREQLHLLNDQQRLRVPCYFSRSALRKRSIRSSLAG